MSGRVFSVCFWQLIHALALLFQAETKKLQQAGSGDFEWIFLCPPGKPIPQWGGQGGARQEVFHHCVSGQVAKDMLAPEKKYELCIQLDVVKYNEASSPCSCLSNSFRWPTGLETRGFGTRRTCQSSRMKLTCIPGSQLPVCLPRRAKPTPQRRQIQVHTYEI